MGREICPFSPMSYKQFKINKLDPISSTFCAAKWLNADFYLYNGTTSSCNFPSPHKIDFDRVSDDINCFHNTREKIEQRQMMLNGEQPPLCSNCWNIENVNPTAMTERIIFSKDYENLDFTKFDLSTEWKPKTITVAIDTICNFTCSYCDASQSSSWATDLKINGPFKNLQGDPRNTYSRLGNSLNEQEYRKVFDFFKSYTEHCLSDLEILTCLGGEPLTSPNFKEYFEFLLTCNTQNLTLRLVTNLSNIKYLDYILSYRYKFKEIQLFVSIDSIGKRAEFIRGGLEWEQFNLTIESVLDRNIRVSILSTIPGIACDGLIDFLNWFTELYDKYKENVTITLNRLRHPNFQAIEVLPKTLKIQYKNELTDWLANNSIHDQAVEQIKNIIVSLESSDSSDLLQNSFKTYYKEYARRHNFNIVEIFSKELTSWIIN